MARKLIKGSAVVAVLVLPIGTAWTGDALRTNDTHRPGDLGDCNEAFVAAVTELSPDHETVRVRFASGAERLLSAQERRMVAPMRSGARLCLQDDVD